MPKFNVRHDGKAGREDDSQDISPISIAYRRSGAVSDVDVKPNVVIMPLDHYEDPEGEFPSEEPGRPAASVEADERPTPVASLGPEAPPTPVALLGTSESATADAASRAEEPGGRAAAAESGTSRRQGARWLTIGLVVLAIGQGGVIAALLLGRFAPIAPNAVAGVPAPTAVVVESAEPGADVMVDGRKVGVTPMTLDVSSTTRSIRVAAAAPNTPAAGAVPLAAEAFGQLQITSEPGGAAVTVDGRRRGVTPLTVQVSPGQHAVEIGDGASTSTRSVNVIAGGTAVLMASFAPTGSTAGWLSLTTPLEVQVVEDGTLLGTSAARLMLPAGRHDLELTNTVVGFRTTLSVDVQGGKAVTMNVPVPNGSVSINALPWANVFLDGRPLGSTPIANLEVPLGTHEVIWRHPQLAEKRQTVTVTARAPLRVVMDLTK